MLEQQKSNSWTRETLSSNPNQLHWKILAGAIIKSEDRPAGVQFSVSIKITKKRYVSDFLETLHVYFLLAMYHKYNNISGL